MQKKLTITVDEMVYEGLHKRIGVGRISHFIEGLVRPHVLDEELEQGYAQMAQDQRRKSEALEWAEATVRIDHSHQTTPHQPGRETITG